MELRTNPTFIPNPTPGAGSSGNVFGLDWAQAVEAQNFINGSGYTFDQVRIGLGAELQQFDGAHAYFWIANIPGLVPEPPIPPSEIPEPATFLMIGGGLLALGLVGRRFRRN
ncbi:MAG: PEP-CTERM sorting domain-containing protein [Bryobacterales bacterium]|nr:PEP-CTERM sorting domain-containing protein [Bryobacterales bacterium]